MLDKLNATFAFQQQALSLRETRQTILASNIANADTPVSGTGYRFQPPAETGDE